MKRWNMSPENRPLNVAVKMDLLKDALQREQGHDLIEYALVVAFIAFAAIAGYKDTGHTYDYRLVALSVVIAILAVYAALDLSVRVMAARGRIRVLWLSGGAFAIGTGIWCMHYIGMLAFRMPVASLLAAVFASGIALFVVSRKTMGLASAIAGSFVMGGGIAAMHYIGMEAIRLPAMYMYATPMVVLLVALAIVISFVALWFDEQQ
jgi:NO-binding membrane sensor protein with MHYT domain